MGLYLFEHSHVYFSSDGQQGCMPWDEFCYGPLRSDRQAHVLVVEHEGAALMARVREVYALFQPGVIKTFVPYAQALAAYLQGRHLIRQEAVALVVDDLGDRFLVTAFNGHEAQRTRVIAKDHGKIIEELKRSQKDVCDKLPPSATTKDVYILSNSRDVIHGLDSLQGRAAVYFETAFPAFSVLGKVSFPVQLMTLEQMARAKRRAWRRQVIFLCLVSMVMGVSGWGYAWRMHARNQLQDIQISALNAARVRITEDLERVSVAAYQERLRRLDRVQYAELVDELSRSVGAYGKVESFSFERQENNAWTISAYIGYPRDEMFAFAGQGRWEGALAAQVFRQGRSGIRVRQKLGE